MASTLLPVVGEFHLLEELHLLHRHQSLLDRHQSLLPEDPIHLLHRLHLLDRIHLLEEFHLFHLLDPLV